MPDAKQSVESAALTYKHLPPLQMHNSCGSFGCLIGGPLETHGQQCTVQDIRQKAEAEPPDHRTRKCLPTMQVLRLERLSKGHATPCSSHLEQGGGGGVRD